MPPFGLGHGPAGGAAAQPVVFNHGVGTEPDGWGSVKGSISTGCRACVRAPDAPNTGTITEERAARLGI